MVESMISEQVTKLRQRRTAPLILELDLTDGIIEERPADPLSAAVLARRKLLLEDVLDGLRRFYRGTLDRLGVEFQVGKRHEYKNAADQFTERSFTGPAREATERLAASITGQLTDAIAARRKIDPAQARALIDQGPFLAAQALEAGLVDALGYRDEVFASVRKQAGPDAILQYVSRYRRSHALAERARKLPAPRQEFVALIYATGPIRRGRSSRGPLPVGGGMGSETVAD